MVEVSIHIFKHAAIQMRELNVMHGGIHGDSFQYVSSLQILGWFG